MSADLPAMARVTVSQLGLTYPVLSDSARKFIQDYNILHPQEGIARPALFVVDREGMVRWQYVGMNAADRPPMGEVIDQLRAIQ